MKLRRDMHPNGGYFVSLPKEKVKLLDWCEGDVLSVDVVKDLFTIRKVSERQYPHPEPGERIEDLDHPRKAPDVPKRVAVSKTPAEIEISAEMNAQEPEKTINITATPAMKECHGVPGTLSVEGPQTCPVCNAPYDPIDVKDLGSYETKRKCRACGADLIAFDKQMNIWRQMHKDPIGR